MIQSLNHAMAQWTGSHFATLLSAKLKPLLRDGKKLYEIPIAVTGAWVKHGHRFQITPDDLAAMVRNFRKRKNEQVVIDYEHASETPEVAQGGPIPAAGWIHDLSFVLGPSSVVRTSAAKDEGQGTKDVLSALVEWTREAEELIQQGAYRFFSPAIEWGYRDKETGEPQGATLTSGALTNHPFLEELPPIMLTDLENCRLPIVDCRLEDGKGVGSRESGAGKKKGIGSRSREGSSSFSLTPYSLLPTPFNRQSATDNRQLESGTKQGGSNVKKLSLRKFKEGPLAGGHGVFDGDDAMGCVDTGDFCDYVKSLLEDGELDDVFGESQLSEVSAERAHLAFAERVGMPGASPEAIRERLAWAGTVEAERCAGAARALLMETVKDGEINQARAMELAAEHKIALADYIAAQDAEKRLNEAVREGKILPRDRQFFFRDALERPAEFAEFARRAVPVVRLGSQGIGSAGDISVDEEVEIRTRNLMKDESLSYARALKRVLASDKELERRYHGVHRREIGSTTAPAAGGIDAAGITQ
jgi:phage I-like protein